MRSENNIQVIPVLKKRMARYKNVKWTYKIGELYSFRDNKNVFRVIVYGHKIIRENNRTIELVYPPRAQLEIRLDASLINDDTKRDIVNKLKEITFREYIEIGEVLRIKTK